MSESRAHPGLTKNDNCPRCGVKMLEEEGEDLHCRGCGTIFYGKLREEPGKRHTMAHDEKLKRHRYYESNKQDIISDAKSIGHVPTCKKWGIPAGSLPQLLARWGSKATRGAGEPARG